MSAERLGRRAVGVRAGGALAAWLGASSAFAARSAHARARTPTGGTLTLRVPWPLRACDPHALEDPVAALFGAALFDGLFAPAPGAASGAVVPALADGPAEATSGAVRVRLRAGVRTAAGRALAAEDAAFAIDRARRGAGRALLAALPVPKVQGDALVFATRDRERVERLLASPLAVVVPRGFRPEAPDGTGPFRAAFAPGILRLDRNDVAARGPAFLERVTVRAADGLADSLRAFEAGKDDVGWLGSGLHEPRPGARPFDFGAAAHVVLTPGRDAGPWAAPGVLQRVLDGVPPSRLAFLHLGPPWATEADDGWGGPSGPLLVRDDAPFLVEVARGLAAALSRPGHELVVTPLPNAELERRRASRLFTLALGLVRTTERDPGASLVALATAEGNDAARAFADKPPRLVDPSVRKLGRTLRSGVVGELRVQGGRDPSVELAPGPLGGFDLGASYRPRSDA